MNPLSRIAIFIIGFLVLGCAPKAAPIVYGTDGCHFCSMTIVDRQHAAQIVTKKGKAYKFDAIECMVNQLKDIDLNSIELFLVNDYEEPGELIDAKKSTFLISKDIPSPMGEYLSAFKLRTDAERVELENKGKLYTWDELLIRFKVQ